MDSIILPFKAPAASNYSTSVGKVVSLTAVASGEARCTLLTATSDDTLANLPLGVIVAADNANGGTVSVCVFGRCQALAAEALTPGTDTLLMTGVGSLVYKATDGNMVLGRLLHKQVAAANDWIEIFVNPDTYEAT